MPDRESDEQEGWQTVGSQPNRPVLSADSVSVSGAARLVEPTPCRHDSLRADFSLDDHCLRCGADGYWHDGHRYDVPHPSAKMLLRLDCGDDADEERGPYV